jgi:glycosyltransferase involved in cell wall biosynthesis
VIVVDDGSTDDTRERLEQFGDSIRYHLQENRGKQGARNRGVQLSTGPYVALLDSDDLWLPGKLKRDIEFLLANPEVGMTCARMAVIDQEGNPTGGLKPTEPPGKTLEEVVVRGSALSTSFTIRREVLERVGEFDESLLRFEDLDIVLTVLEGYRIELFAEPMALYRDHPGNLSKDLWGIFVGRFHLTSKWSRRFTDAKLRRICRRHVRDCSRVLAAGYLKRGRPLKSLRFAGEYLRAQFQLLR